MPRGRGQPRDPLLARQKAAAERLRRETLGADGSLRHPYFRDIRRQLRTYEAVASLADLHDACGRADLIYVGDFHATPACQTFAAELLEHLARLARPLALGVEFVYTRQQRLLDRRQAGLLNDDTFLKRIHYREEWGYPWEGFRRLLDRARELGVSVHALDAPPRGGFHGLPRRDEHAARRISAILRESPRTRLVVLFGESHVSRGHIPRRVRRHLRRDGLEVSELTVFQNPDAIYWDLASREEAMPRAVRVAPDTFAVFHLSPLSKYESYRQVRERWRGDVPPDEEVDLTPAVHHLIEVLLGWLGIRANRRRLRYPAGWSEELADAFPEVYSGPEATELIAPVLEEHKRSLEEIEEAQMLLSSRGALYDSRSNTLFLLRYLPGRAAGEGARFLRAALSGRLFLSPEPAWSDPVARAYGVAYDEALVFLGSRLVDPAAGLLSDEERLALTASAGSVPQDLPADLVERVRWLEAHRDFEATGGTRVPRSLLEPLFGSRLVRRTLARDLGHRLGHKLYEAVRRGTLQPAGLRSLFRRSLTEERVQRIVMQLLRRGVGEKKAAPGGRG